MSQFRKSLVALVTVVAFGSIAYGMRAATQSSMFVVQVVEVIDQPERAPVEAQRIVDLASVPSGSANLFDLSLKTIEKRILTDPWIRSVRLQKRFPQTLSISVAYREPKAAIQNANGDLSYVDSDGHVFGHVNLMTQPDLPILSGFKGDHLLRVPDALKLLRTWEDSQLGKSLQVSSVIWDSERGFRILVAYPLKSGTASLAKGRTIIDIGQEVNGSVATQLKRLTSVFGYLGDHSILANQIWADSGKKIVVRTTHGS